MSGILPGDPSHHGMAESSPYRVSHDMNEDADPTGASWYLSRRELDEDSPSRKDGISLKKENNLRKSFCTFLQDFGMRLKVPQVTIATAIVFCHRFFLRQSHAKNDRRTIATVCMFLAGKVEESPRPLKDVILVSYEIIHKKDPVTAQRIKQREVYEQQKELILLGERLVLTTLDFDLSVHHPYRPLVEAIKKFKVAQNNLAQVAWNFVNDGLRTSLCLQFKPHHIAAGAIFLAAKFLKVKLPSDGEKVWWQEFDVTPRTLEEVSNQMLELYEQNLTAPPSHGNEAEGSSAVGPNHCIPIQASSAVKEPPLQNGYLSAAGTTSMQHGTHTSPTNRALQDQLHVDRHNGVRKILQANSISDHEAKEPRTGVAVNKIDYGFKDHQPNEQGNLVEASSSQFNHHSENQGGGPGMAIPDGSTEATDRISGQNEGLKWESPMVDAIKKIDKDKVRAALEKRRKTRIEVARNVDVMDDDDLIERELESGIELAAEDGSTREERRPTWSRPYRQELQNPDHGTEGENVEEEELSFDTQKFPSPEFPCRKRKAESPGKLLDPKDVSDLPHYPVPPSKHQDSIVDSPAMGCLERAERDHKRLGQESQV